MQHSLGSLLGMSSVLYRAHAFNFALMGLYNNQPVYRRVYRMIFLLNEQKKRMKPCHPLFSIFFIF